MMACKCSILARRMALLGCIGVFAAGSNTEPAGPGWRRLSLHQSERGDRNSSEQVNVGVGTKLLRCIESP